jgi:D-alanyl-lipoteichoic acid acyltransferase DltB (MBOAT superfamily)
MVLGGFWHGAQWTFVFWGFLHGVYLLINYGWQNLLRKAGYKQRPNWLMSQFAQILTFIAVVFAWVFFRSESFHAGVAFLKSMMGLNGFALWTTYLAQLNKFFGLGNQLVLMGWEFGFMDYFDKEELFHLLGLLFIVWIFPNTQQIMTYSNASLENAVSDQKILPFQWMYWQPKIIWACITSIMLIASISFYMNQVSEFLYFQF